jgi:hypothetical protein
MEKIPLDQTDAEKQFRYREIGGPSHIRGKIKFRPPKEALVSP